MDDESEGRGGGGEVGESKGEMRCGGKRLELVNTQYIDDVL